MPFNWCMFYSILYTVPIVDINSLMKKVLTKAQRRKLADWIGISNPDSFAPDTEMEDAYMLVKHIESVKDPDILHNVRIAMCVGALSYIRYKEGTGATPQPSDTK